MPAAMMLASARSADCECLCVVLYGEMHHCLVCLLPVHIVRAAPTPGSTVCSGVFSRMPVAEAECRPVSRSCAPLPSSPVAMARRVTRSTQRVAYTHSPISSLATETLLAMLDYAAEAEPGTLLVSSLVCQRWRDCSQRLLARHVTLTSTNLSHLLASNALARHPTATLTVCDTGHKTDPPSLLASGAVLDHIGPVQSLYWSLAPISWTALDHPSLKSESNKRS